IVGAIFDLGTLLDSKTLRFMIRPKDAQESQQVIAGENQMAVLRPRFATRSASLSDEDKRAIDQLVRKWRDQDWQQITIVGHSDDVPIAPQNRTEFADNKALSEARAAAVAEYIGGKLKVDKLVVVGAGDQYPVASNATRAGRQSNRRVEFLLKPEPVIVKRNIVDASVLNGESFARMSFASAGTPKGRTETSKLPLNRLVGGFDKLSSVVSGTAVGSWDLVENLGAPEVVERDPNVQGFISIAAGDRLGMPVQAVKFDLDSRLKPRLSLDGEEISRERIGFRMADDTTGKTLYSYIGVNFGEPGTHTLTLEGLDPFGNARYSESIDVVRVGELYTIRMVSAEGNIADGRTPVKVKFELYDRSGEPLGINYRVELRDTELRRNISDLSLTDLSKIADANFIDIDASGYAQFDPVSISGTYPFTLKYNDFEREFEVFVEAEKRDWIMVGLAEGSVAYNNISGNMVNAEAAGLEDEISTDGRVAFYAKGQVKGEYVLTIAYDTDKARKTAREQTIDPNSFYTLYGDKASTQYDAASQEKLFLKLEKDQFYALFGDFTTGLNGGELSTYSRSLTGLKSEYKNDSFDVVVFASETDQAFIKDEIRGDGTSGLYRLSTPGLIVNSEQISIEVRDRFRSQDILEVKELRRHLDYNIDYDAGTLFFKEPIFSQDASFNPQFIVVDYEVDSRGADELNYGGRVAYTPNEDLEVGVTLVREGVERRESDLAGIDVEYQLNENTEIRAEVATTESNVDGVKSDGTAYLIEATHRSGNLDAQAYIREQQGAFGLGQQNDSESGTRKVGIDAKYQIAEGIEVAGEIYRDSNLGNDTDQDVASASVQMRGDQYTVSTGVRTAMTSGGGAEDRVSNQLMLGGSYQVLDGRLVLSANADTPIGGKGEEGNFPRRLRVGLDYKLNESITLKAEQEFTWGDEEDTQGTRIGMSTNLWEGGELVTSVEQTDEENSQRLAAVAGLLTCLMVCERSIPKSKLQFSFKSQ
ncbi:MAG: OmpA family protein, partial [Pseudomonadales bacterium]